jgi:hypothetical protein
MPKIKTDKQTFVYKTIPIYLGIKKIDKVQAKENLLLLKKILDVKQIPFGLAYGTLLGAVREKDFIEHDEDIDLYILAEYKNRFFEILSELLNVGFEIARYDPRGTLFSMVRKGEYIDFYFFSQFQSGLMVCGGEIMPEKYFLNTTTIPFIGADFVAPREYIDFLEFYYGKDWNIPHVWTNYEFNKFQRYLLEIKYKIKDLLPTCIAMIIIKQREKQKRMRYMEKIKNYDNNFHHYHLP